VLVVIGAVFWIAGNAGHILGEVTGEAYNPRVAILWS
jgi:hypothetical protein